MKKDQEQNDMNIMKTYKRPMTCVILPSTYSSILVTSNITVDGNAGFEYGDGADLPARVKEQQNDDGLWDFHWDE